MVTSNQSHVSPEAAAVLVSVLDRLRSVTCDDDSDEAVLRCACRAIVELLGRPLSDAPLLKEHEPRTPKFFMQYRPADVAKDRP